MARETPFNLHPVRHAAGRVEPPSTSICSLGVSKAHQCFGQQIVKLVTSRCRTQRLPCFSKSQQGERLRAKSCRLLWTNRGRVVVVGRKDPHEDTTCSKQTSGEHWVPLGLCRSDRSAIFQTAISYT